MDRIRVNGCGFMDYMDNYSGQEIAIFGYGLAAENMYKLLINHRIRPNHIIVNKRFLSPDMNINGQEVEAIEDLAALTDKKFDIIMMPQSYRIGWLEPFKDIINRVLFYDVTPALGSDGGGYFGTAKTILGRTIRQVGHDIREPIRRAFKKESHSLYKSAYKW